MPGHCKRGGKCLLPPEVYSPDKISPCGQPAAEGDKYSMCLEILVTLNQVTGRRQDIYLPVAQGLLRIGNKIDKIDSRVGVETDPAVCREGHLPDRRIIDLSGLMDLQPVIPSAVGIFGKMVGVYIIGGPAVDRGGQGSNTRIITIVAAALDGVLPSCCLVDCRPIELNIPWPCR